jgi:predicted NAD-dependent protein-ADP-ribosyltransferase YbiA (DUF1768 family)
VVVTGISLIFENHYKIDTYYPNNYTTDNMTTNQHGYTLFDGANGENGFLSVGYVSMIHTDLDSFSSAAEYIVKSAHDMVHSDGMGNNMVDVDLLKAEMDVVTTRFPSLENEIDWMDPSKTVCYAANIYKFDQNPELLDMLLSTGGTVIVFANKDNFGAGVGFSIENAMANQLEWGNNMLGGVLMRLRDLYKTEMQK